MNDYSQAAYNYLMHQQDNALQIALMNYQNEWNSPTHQMLLKQAAGLSPYSQGQSLSAQPSTNAPPRFSSSGTFSKGIQQANATIGNLISALHAGKEIYDYAKYGRTISGNQMLQSQSEARRAQLGYEWDEYLLTGYNPAEESGSRKELIANGPRAQMFQKQMDVQEQRFEQLKAIVDMIPDQEARVKALKELDDYRLKIMKGQNDAILHINTGNATVDAVLKAISYYMVNNL